MPFVEYPQQALGFTIKKRLGKPNMFGWIIPGWSEFGDDNIFAGVYQQRRNRVGNGKNKPVQFGSQKNFMQLPAWPPYVLTTRRVTQQEKLKTALLMWQNLTEEEKSVYNKTATRRSKRGFDLFMSKTLKSL